MRASDSQWMARALQLARRGLLTAAPNPRVGCVLVKDEERIGEGWHQRAGEAHAEVHALRAAGNAAQGATAYVTLEPCSHHGRTPPCAEALIAAGVARVVCAMQDPNPQVAGQGIAMLRAAGIAVECGLMEAQARELNPGFVSRMTRGLPFVRSKIAASLDGRTALANGESRWITGDAARQDVQQWRARSCALLTGIGTVLADDPQLNVRIENELCQRQSEVSSLRPTERQPLRVVLDTALRMPPTARILQGGGVLVCTASQDAGKRSALQQQGAEILQLADAAGQVDLQAVMRELAKRGINEVLVEAGRELNGALLRAGLVDELLLYLAPQLLGDTARGMADLGELLRLEQKVELAWRDVRRVGEDLRITAEVKNV